jgi:Heterokaryon incompatibility protein (HET)
VYRLIIDEQQRTVPENLVHAVFQFQKLEQDGYFWIDAICINQLDNKERSAQVNMMDKIYQKAEAVDVWLGKWTPDAGKVNGILLELLRVYGEYHNVETYPIRRSWTIGPYILPAPDWELFAQLLSRRWFHRLWALQEFALAAKVNLRCGPYIIDLKLL